MRRILHLMEAHTAHAASQLDGCKTVVMRKGEAAFTRQENGFSFSIDSVSAFLARPEGFMHYARLLRLPEVGEVVITTPLAREAADLAAILRLEALRAGKACRVLMPDDPARRAAGSITTRKAGCRLAGGTAGMPAGNHAVIAYGPVQYPLQVLRAGV